ncbi:MAG: PEP-CTERM sorting domain-containing protein [Phycisphaerae bacterium]|nr:PEP-CTERM sorting domain-containing protein [Phycisphaerae bacterium]
MKMMLKVSIVLLAMMGLNAYGTTIAHWDFADVGAIDGANMPGNGERADLDSDGAMDTDDFRISSTDLSGNGNHLTAWTGSWMHWNADSYMGDFSMQNNNNWPAAGTDSAYNPYITGIDAEAITPAQWTIEAVIKPTALGGNQTFVGRDGPNVGGSGSGAAAVYFSTRGTDLAIEYRDVDGAGHNLQIDAGLSNDIWYSLAAVSDGSTLSLYINGTLQSTTLDLTTTGTDTALGQGEGIWTISRGKWSTSHVDRFFGLVDEVAISDEALAPETFVVPEPATLVLLSLGSLAMIRKRK